MKTKRGPIDCEVQRFGDAQREALQAVIDFFYDDEARDYRSRQPLERAGHIFADLSVLASWLAERKRRD